MFSKFWHNVNWSGARFFMFKMRNGHFKKLFSGKNENHLGDKLIDLRGGEGGGSANPVGVMKMLSFSYSFVYFSLFGFHENLKLVSAIFHYF